jgi:peptidoglycan-N-acetylglucosamine deacetylase
MKKLKKIVKGLIPRTLIIQRLSKIASNSILFTFDDGPHKILTPLILEILEEYQVRAMFFVVGRNVYNNPYILKSIKDRGHYIGNHSYEHHNGPLPNFFAYRRDILKCQNLVESIVGSELSFFRPPRGRIIPKTLLAAKSCQLKSILWSNEGGELGNRSVSEPATIAKAVLETLKPRDIILLHDNNPKVPEILKLILPVIKKSKFDLMDGLRSLKT